MIAFGRRSHWEDDHIGKTIAFGANNTCSDASTVPRIFTKSIRQQARALPFMAKTGRRRDEFVFTQFSDPFEKANCISKFATCKHCKDGAALSFQVDRLRKHLSTCDAFRKSEALTPYEYSKFMVRH